MRCSQLETGQVIETISSKTEALCMVDADNIATTETRTKQITVDTFNIGLLNTCKMQASDVPNFASDIFTITKIPLISISLSFVVFVFVSGLVSPTKI